MAKNESETKTKAVLTANLGKDRVWQQKARADDVEHIWNVLKIRRAVALVQQFTQDICFDEGDIEKKYGETLGDA